MKDRLKEGPNSCADNGSFWAHFMGDGAERNVAVCSTSDCIVYTCCAVNSTILQSTFDANTRVFRVGALCDVVLLFAM